MFIALDVSISLVAALRSIVARVRLQDAAMARQIVSAASSVALNLAEGAKRAGKDQLHFYRIAAGSCAEVRAAVAVARAWGWLDGVDVEAAVTLLDRETALLHRLLHPRRS